MNIFRRLKTKQGRKRVEYFPITHTDGVVDNNNITLTNIITTIYNRLDNIKRSLNSITDKVSANDNKINELLENLGNRITGSHDSLLEKINTNQYNINDILIAIFEKLDNIETVATVSLNQIVEKLNEHDKIISK